MLNRDQLEFAISQYIDGTLPPLETAALEETLATDAEARALLEEYRQLDRVVKASAGPLPEVAWDRLAAHVSDAVAREEPPVRNYTLPVWRRRALTAALAACLAFAFFIGYLAYQDPDQLADAPQSPAPIAIVVGPQPEQPQNQQAVVQIAIGPAPSMSDSWRYAESVISRPAVVMIDRGSRPGQDTESFWY